MNTLKNLKEVSIKTLTQEFFDAAFINFDAKKTLPLITQEYIQHNPVVPSGAEGFLQILPILGEGGMKFKNHRIIADESFVVSHNEVSNVPIPGYGDVITFDVWRMEDGKLAEHWDNVTKLQEVPNASGHMQTDGTKDVIDLDKTQVNKSIVLDFFDQVLVSGDLSKIADYLDDSNLIQHNVEMEDGADALYQVLKQGVKRYEKRHLAVAEGNFVFVASQGFWKENTVAFFDLYRLENGKIVEQWDVIEEISDNWAHNNGKF